MLILMLLLGCGLGGLRYVGRVRRDTVAAIERSGGEIRYDWQKDRRYPGKVKPSAPGWLTDLFGVEYHDDVIWVDLVGFASDADLVHVARLRRLERLNLNGRAFTDAGLVHLSSLEGLNELDLSRTAGSDAGLVHLKGLISLGDSRLQRTRVTDAGVAALRQALPHLREVAWDHMTQ